MWWASRSFQKIWFLHSCWATCSRRQFWSASQKRRSSFSIPQILHDARELGSITWWYLLWKLQSAPNTPPLVPHRRAQPPQAIRLRAIRLPAIRPRAIRAKRAPPHSAGNPTSFHREKSVNPFPLLSGGAGKLGFEFSIKQMHFAGQLLGWYLIWSRWIGSFHQQCLYLMCVCVCVSNLRSKWRVWWDMMIKQWFWDGSHLPTRWSQGVGWHLHWKASWGHVAFFAPRTCKHGIRSWLGFNCNYIFAWIYLNWF